MAALLNIFLFISLSLLIFTTSPSLAQSVAPGPTAPPNNITAILEAGGQYTTLIRLLTSTRVDVQLNSQLNNSFNGLTCFAPTDNAFNQLPAGTLNKLTEQEQIEVVLFHVLPRFYTMAMFGTTSNPVNTQASGSDGADTLDIISSTSQVNISTGVVNTTITNTLSSSFPLAVYSIEKVLLPYSIFGVKPPAPAPSPKVAKSSNKTPSNAKAPSSSESAGGTADSNSGINSKGRAMQWTTSFVGLILMSVIFRIF
ncbi:Fasciclin-like arabinogalactan family protein [Rhynchospora pubera]|uniref:Fasciclin-like arabinogalactan family protein n=1 Tax=Rhynchospora pubera TaxID=906938 RepID=A0AAV8DFF7_9POAL|nr:Fasciclin-like arabinogalactan family protein [Rhynchospora pubera]